MHSNEDDLVLHYYGELNAAEEARTADHIARCPDCHHAYRRIQQVLAAVNEETLSVPEPRDGFERTVWARLEPALERPRASWLSSILASPSRLGWAPLALLLLAGAFYAGRLSRPGLDAPPAPAATTAAATSQARERIFLIGLSEHLDRSQRVLVELVSADDASTAAFAGERSRAEDLVSDNRLYRQTAAATGDNAVIDLLDQLERVLVEVAASPSDSTARELEDVRRRIEAGSLLFKVRVVSSDLQERRNAAVRQAGQRSSL
jgi:anti-sigma factor RsiW